MRHEKIPQSHIASILTAITAWDPYDITYEDSKPSSTSIPSSLHGLDSALPLLYWSPKHWSSLSGMLSSIMEHFQIKYSTTLEKIMSCIILHEKLAILRVPLEMELAQKSSGPVTLDESMIKHFM
jgi:hypothetical protein